MKKQLKQLEEFQKAFNQCHNQEPSLIDKDDFMLRYKLIEEELEEYKQACFDRDIVEISDAITDLLYVVLGTAVSHGIQNVLPDIFQEVHESNMSKLDDNGKAIINGLNGVNDKTRPHGKVLKSKNYFEPNINPILQKGYLNLK